MQGPDMRLTSESMMASSRGRGGENGGEEDDGRRCSRLGSSRMNVVDNGEDGLGSFGS